MGSKRPVVLWLTGLLLMLSLSPLAVAELAEDDPSQITRIMMLPPEAEVTGMHVTETGQFFVNAMHPDEDHYKATVGVVNGVDWNNLPESVPELAASSHPQDVWHGIRTSYGDYQVLVQSGDALSEGGVAGGIYALDDGGEILVSQKPDYNAFVPSDERGHRGFLYTAWEDRPAGISQLELEWDSTAAEWVVVSSRMLNLSSINGGWVLCFGSVSPWGTPLLSEELYFDDTEFWNDEGFRYHSDQAKLHDYLGVYPNPYDYGYIIEIENADTLEPALNRHLAMGRFSHENAMVMPDNKTVYLTDDGYDTVFYKFVATTPGDLSSGTLFAAQVTQDSGWDAATTGFDVEWMELGSSSSSEVQSWIDDYDGITPADYVSGQNSYISDEEINDWAESRTNDDLNGDGKIGTAVDDRVAFLESRKAAAALGASDEWNKMEGVAFNPNAPNNAYLAMSSIANGMTDGTGDIDVSQNYCGIVYRLSMNGAWNINRIDPVLSGGPYTSSATYECDRDNLAGPDNLLVLDDGRLLIGEDTRKHEYNTVWLWQEATWSRSSSERISTSKVTSLDNGSENLDAWSYEYRAEVSDLNDGMTYTAIIMVKEADDELKSLWWWNDIDENGAQFERTFALTNGCYLINTSLYERDELSEDVKNATVLSTTELNLTVGQGSCNDGEFVPNSPLTNTTEDDQAKTDEGSSEGLPGFGVLVFFAGVFCALVIVHRREDEWPRR